MGNTVVRPCRGCGDALPPKHLRTQVAPPDDKWHEIRTHNLTCLVDFLEREEDTVETGQDGELFKAVSVRGEGTTAP